MNGSEPSVDLIGFVKPRASSDWAARVKRNNKGLNNMVLKSGDRFERGENICEKAVTL